MKKVKTFDNTIALLKNCVKLDDNRYYEIDKQCLLMEDGKWYKINDASIVKDHNTNKYVLLNSKLLSGIVGVGLNNELKFGFFSENKAQNIILKINDEELICINRNILHKINNIVEDIKNGILVLNKNKSEEPLFKQKLIKKYYDLPFNYRCDNLLTTVTDIFDEYFQEQKFKHGFYKKLPDVSFGIEYETYGGRLFMDEMLQNGLIPVRDGSLVTEEGYQAYEYATVILKGANGLSAIKKQCEILNRCCKVDYSGSLHVHLGGIPLSKEYAYALTLVGSAIETEIYAMFPEAMQNTKLFKRSNYCNPIHKHRYIKDDFDNNFNKMYSYLSMKEDHIFEGFNQPHPSDRSGEHKWEVRTRYVWMNLIPMFFSKNGTVEYRVHTSSFNSDKIINWIYIVSAISKYAFNHKDEISKLSKCRNLTLAKIIKEIYESKILNSYLINYINYRKALMLEHAELGDKYGKLDVENDNLNKFNYKFKSIAL